MCYDCSKSEFSSDGPSIIFVCENTPLHPETLRYEMTESDAFRFTLLSFTPYIAQHHNRFRKLITRFWSYNSPHAKDCSSSSFSFSFSHSDSLIPAITFQLSHYLPPYNHYCTFHLASTALFLDHFFLSFQRPRDDHHT